MIRHGEEIRRYPWDDWFSRKGFVLKPGRDYDCLTITMVNQIRTQASKRNLRVTISTNHEGTIWVTVVGIARKKPRRKK